MHRCDGISAESVQTGTFKVCWFEKWWRFGCIGQLHTLKLLVFGFSGCVFYSSWQPEFICSNQAGSLHREEAPHFPGAAFWQPCMLLDWRSRARSCGVRQSFRETSTSSLLGVSVSDWALSFTRNGTEMIVLPALSEADSGEYMLKCETDSEAFVSVSLRVMKSEKLCLITTTHTAAQQW